MFESLVKTLHLSLKAFRKSGYILNPKNKFLNVYQKELPLILSNKKLNAVDIGGAVDLQPHWRKMIGNAHLHIFEPHPKSYKDLVSKYGLSPHHDFFHVYPLALSGSGGKRTLLMTNVPTGSTILEFNEASPYFHKENPYFFPMTSMEIDTVPLEGALEKESVNTVDIIKLDIQGPELEVLKSLGETRLNTLLAFEMEVNLQNLYKEGTIFPALYDFVQKNNFEFFDFRVARGFHQRNGKTDFSKKHFDIENWSPAVAAKAGEFDVVCFKKPGKLLEAKDSDSLRRLISLYCIYNFFFEAVELAEESLSKNIFSKDEFDIIRTAVISMKKSMDRELNPYSKIIKGMGDLNWGQYMWLKYPTT